MLYQLPPSLKLDLQRLEDFLKLIPPDLANVFEFRNPSWYVPEVYALLDRYGASFCVHDMAGSKTERIAVGPAAYVRFHGGEGKYWGRYSDERLLGWTDWVARPVTPGAQRLVLFQQRHPRPRAYAQTLKSMSGRCAADQSSSDWALSVFPTLSVPSCPRRNKPEPSPRRGSPSLLPL